jgi:hypothetical protein
VTTAQSDLLLKDVLTTLGLDAAHARIQFTKIEAILAELGRRHATKAISGSVTGAISERLCGIALDGAAPRGLSYTRLPRQWKWLGDFSVRGIPFNVLISVKSFTAKERLLASGSGVLLAPTIGFGFFKEAKEWNAARLDAYVYRGFLAVYLPNATLCALSRQACMRRNVNGRRFLRRIDKFSDDLVAALHAKRPGYIDPREL